YAQFFGLPNNGLSVRKSTGNSKNRQLINELRHFLALNDSALKWKTGDFNNPPGFDLINVFNGLAHLRAHSKQNTKQRRSFLVKTNIANDKMPSLFRRSRDEPKSRGRDVARNREVARFRH